MPDTAIDEKQREKLRRKWYYDSDEGDRLLESIKRRYGLFGDNSTVLRFIIRLVALPDAVSVKVAQGESSKAVKKAKKAVSDR